MRPGTIRSSGPGVAAVLDRLAREAKGLQIAVGVQGAPAREADDENPDVTVLDKAVWNEFGTDTIPPRPFLRTSAREFRKQWSDAFRVRFKEAVLGRRSLVSGASIVGNIARADVQRKMTIGPWVPNAARTIARKGSSSPLIDTGQLRQSIRYEVSQGGVVKDSG